MKTKTIKRKEMPKTPPSIHTMGVVLARNDLSKALVRAHVAATQEYNHEKAKLLEDFIVALGNLHKKQPKKHSYLKWASDQLYDLDDRVAKEFQKPTPPLFMASTHGYILAELCEIRQLINCAVNTNEKNG